MVIQLQYTVYYRNNNNNVAILLIDAHYSTPVSLISSLVNLLFASR